MSFRRGARVLAAAALLAVGIAPRPLHAQEVITEQRSLPLPKTDQLEAPRYGPATVETLADLELMPQDFWGHATLGDTILRNDRAWLAFGALLDSESGPANAEQAARPGHLLDVTSDVRTPESFQLFAPTTRGGLGPSLAARRMTTRTGDDGSATLIVEETDLNHPAVEARTEYLMRPGLPGLLITTTLTNTGEETLPELAPADYVAWGAMGPFIPGKGWVQNQIIAVDDVEFVFGRAHDLFLLISPREGKFDVDLKGSQMVLTYGREGLEPGEARVYSRYLLTGTSDPATLFSLVLKDRAEQGTGTATPFGALLGRVIEREQMPDGTIADRAPVGDSEIRISPVRRPDWTPEQTRELEQTPYLLAQTRDSGQFEALLPVGEYRVFSAPQTRMAPAPQYATRIQEGKVTGVDFGVSPPSRLLFRVLDEETGEPLPAKLTIEPLRGTKIPDLGPPDMPLALNTVLTASGSGSVELSSGNYRIVASHGPEYHTTERRIRMGQPPEQNIQEFRLKRAFSTPGWIAADLGSRTEASPGSRVHPATRVASAAAEGVEWLVTGDLLEITNLQDEVARLGLEPLMKASPGLRISGGKEPFLGDFLFFPVDVCSSGVNPDFASALDEATSTGLVVERLRALCPEGVVLLNRPLWPVTGYLTRLGYDANRAVLPEGDWFRDFDAVQIWEGKRQPVAEANYLLYHKLLADGQKLAMLGTSNSFGTWNEETGYPRVYIKSSTDDPAQIDPAELARNIKQGLTVVTNGPFIKLAANGQPMGSLITDTDGEVDLEIEVFAPNWASISSISFNLNGQFVRRIILPAGSIDPEAGRVYPKAGREAEDGKLGIKVTKDSILDVVVTGDPRVPMDPVNPYVAPSTDPGAQRGQYALAFSAPILIDTDGNGVYDPPGGTAGRLSTLPFEEEDPLF